MKTAIRICPGFTLVEVLTTIAIITILAAISFGVLTGVNEKKAVSQATVEIAAISSALERFKATHGTYPVNDNYVANTNNLLLLALAGVGDADGNALPTDQMRKSYISLEGYSISFADDSARQAFYDNPSAGALSGLDILDPWGEPYRYFYDRIQAATSWRNPSFVLYSVGPDLAESVPSALQGGNGVVEVEDFEGLDVSNLDNVFANQ
ncbi:MAG: prepilin-type N-terminal cleavage/methylation domain-containing protein [Verrucomicrobiota bacterium]